MALYLGNKPISYLKVIKDGVTRKIYTGKLKKDNSQVEVFHKHVKILVVISGYYESAWISVQTWKFDLSVVEADTLPTRIPINITLTTNDVDNYGEPSATPGPSETATIYPTAPDTAAELRVGASASAAWAGQCPDTLLITQGSYSSVAKKVYSVPPRGSTYQEISRFIIEV